MLEQNLRFLKEDGEAPAPQNPNTPDAAQTHNDVDRALSFELGIEPEDMETANETGTLMVHQPISFARKWGFNAKGPIPASVKHLDGDRVSITFHFSQMPSTAFYHPYKQGETPIAHKGDVSDKTEVMRRSELNDIKASFYGLSGAGGMTPPPGGI